MSAVALVSPDLSSRKQGTIHTSDPHLSLVQNPRRFRLLSKVCAKINPVMSSSILSLRLTELMETRPNTKSWTELLAAYHRESTAPGLLKVVMEYLDRRDALDRHSTEQSRPVRRAFRVLVRSVDIVQCIAFRGPYLLLCRAL